MSLNFVFNRTVAPASLRNRAKVLLDPTARVLSLGGRGHAARWLPNIQRHDGLHVSPSSLENHPICADSTGRGDPVCSQHAPHGDVECEFSALLWPLPRWPARQSCPGRKTQGVASRAAIRQARYCVAVEDDALLEFSPPWTLQTRCSPRFLIDQDILLDWRRDNPVGQLWHPCRVHGQRVCPWSPVGWWHHSWYWTQSQTSKSHRERYQGANYLFLKLIPAMTILIPQLWPSAA